MADWAAMVESRDAEIERLKAELATSKRDADLGWEHAEKADEDTREWAELCKEYMAYSRRLLRYRLAWLSARRRAADEANFGMEALALRDAEIKRMKAERATLLSIREGEARATTTPTTLPTHGLATAAASASRLADPDCSASARRRTAAPCGSWPTAPRKFAESRASHLAATPT
ncbi:hypothetical protein ACQEVG_32845 [Streptomyces sp. CA-135486]|uniref:hypothetical protein n=1 Tax=Streptomyces sp. CA-135486 TaxID=3240049 RepID=UPI003D8A4E5A